MSKLQCICVLMVLVLLMTACSATPQTSTGGMETTSVPTTSAAPLPSSSAQQTEPLSTGTDAGKPVAPGTLVDPEKVPQPGTEDIGKLVNLSLDALLNISC